MKKTTSILGLLLLSFCSAWADLQRDQHVRYELLSETPSIAPGTTFTIGLRILHDEGWHTYWKQPGIAGIPTQLDWDLPDGFEASPIQWQQPQTTKMAVYTVYGYEGEAILLTEISAPDSLPVGPDVTLKTRITWMMCAKQCVPSTTEAEITLKTAANPSIDEKVKAELDKIRAGFPRPSDHWKGTAWLTENMVTLRLATEEDDHSPPITPLSPPYFFCADGVVHSDADQKVTKSGNSILELTLERSRFAPEDPARLRGEVVLTSGSWDPDDPDFTSLAIDVPLESR
ncbi:MAG: protein-disulfide reductase DsbD domain-containing protein [Verrucomicrobiota bacterium]